MMDEDDNGAGDGAADDGYVSFRGRQASGVLYRINPMPDELIAKMEEYVHGGPMGQDMRYARAVFGLVNTSGRKDFELFWESPWSVMRHAEVAGAADHFFCTGTKNTCRTPRESESWRPSSAPWPCAATSARAACRCALPRPLFGVLA